jgi:hypothetical protein
LKKPQLDKHRMRCRNATFTCVDCHRTFAFPNYQQHTPCITEAEKYQGKLYKPVRDRVVGYTFCSFFYIFRPANRVRSCLRAFRGVDDAEGRCGQGRREADSAVGVA